MGFSLKMFFEELNALLYEDVTGRELKLKLLKELVKSALYRELLYRFKKEFESDLYLAEDYLDERRGKVMKYDGDNHHNGNPEYVELRDITEKDRDAFKFKTILSRILLK